MGKSNAQSDKCLAGDGLAAVPWTGVSSDKKWMNSRRGAARSEALPPLMTVEEAAELLKISTKALYARIKRGAVPGVVRVGARRMLLKTDELLRGLRRVSSVDDGLSKRPPSTY